MLCDGDSSVLNIEESGLVNADIITPNILANKQGSKTIGLSDLDNPNDAASEAAADKRRTSYNRGTFMQVDDSANLLADFPP